MEERTKKQDIVQVLVDALAEQVPVHGIDTNPFKQILLNAEFPGEKEFMTKLPENEQFFHRNNGEYASLSLRRILRNRSADRHDASVVKRGLWTLGSSLGLYSSDAIVDRLVNDYLVRGHFEASPYPFTLIGKFSLFNFDNPEQTLYVARRPMVIVPEASNPALLRTWEMAHESYEKEVGVFFRKFRKVSQREYTSH